MHNAREFLLSLTATGVLWLSTFALLAWAFPGVGR